MWQTKLNKNGHVLHMNMQGVRCRTIQIVGEASGRPFSVSIVICILNNVSLCVTQKLLIKENTALIFVIGIEVHVDHKNHL